MPPLLTTTPKPRSHHKPRDTVKNPRKRLSEDDIAYILKANSEGHRLRTIAEYLGVSIPLVFKVLHSYSPNEPLAKLFTRASALTVAKASVSAALKRARKGRGDECLEILDRLDVLPKRLEGASAPRVQIAVMMPGQALALDTAPPTFLDVPSVKADEAG